MNRLPVESFLENPVALDPGEVQLRLRAARLAEREAQTEQAEAVELLSFRVGAERFAVPLQLLRGVRAVEKYTPVPGAVAALLGVIYDRGEIVPLVDLGRLLHSPLSIDGPTQALLCREPQRLALGVDEVLGIEQYAPEDLQPVEPGITSGLIEALLPDHTALLRLPVLLASNELHSGKQR